MYDLLIKDATIITGGRRQVADIAVEEGRIAYVGDRPAGRAAQTISAIGRFVMPGAVDASVQVRAPEDWRSISRAAAASGITTLIALDDRTDTGASIVSHGCWGVGREDNAGSLAGQWAEGTICGARLDAAALSAQATAAHFESGTGLIGVHAEGAEAITDLLALVRAHRRPTHLLQVSTAAELALLDPLHGDLPLTSGIAPSHLFLSVETLGRLPAPIRTRPPIRPELDRRAMWTAIKRGRIDTFTSGHTPTAQAAPGGEAEVGLPGVDTLLKLLLSAVNSGRLSLEMMVQMCSGTPARVLGLAGKGQLVEGADADLVLFRESATSRLTAGSIHSAAGWSPFTGRTLASAPQLVVIGGRIVAREGRIVSESPAAPVRYLRG